MLDFSQMLARFVIALLAGALIGLERETAGKEAGFRTNMLVAGGSAIFTMIAFTIPYLTADGGDALGIIAGIVTGIGFLGGGIIIKTQEHVHGLTTAATVWMTAAIGILVGAGLIQFALVAAALVSGILFVTRRVRIPIRQE